jgi:hypothetical protein
MNEDIESLQVILSANAHTRVLRAIVEALGPDAIDEFANAVRRLDQHASGGGLRPLNEIAADRVLEPGAKDGARKQLEQTVRAFVRRAAREVTEAKEAEARTRLQAQQPAVEAPANRWRTLLGLAVIRVLRTYGAVDVLTEWLAIDRRRTQTAREKAQQKARDSAEPVMAEVDKQSSKLSQRSASRVAATNLRSKGRTASSEAVRAKIRRRRKTS